MRTIYGKLTALILAVTLGLLLFLPMRFGQEDHLYAYPHSLRLNRGDTYALSYTLDSDHAQAITYASTDERVATVNAQGQVKAVNPGTADIHIDAEGGAKTSVRVKVDGTPTTSITLNTDAITLEKGQVTGLSASFNEGADDTRMEWRSDDPEIANVDAAGRVTAVKGGRTQVYAATPNGLKAAADVFVHVSGYAMRMTPEDLTVGTGANLQMSTSYYPDDTTDVADRWVSSDERLLRVDADGVIHAVGVGKPVLTVYSKEGLSTSAIINVEPSAETFDLAPSAATLERGETLDMQTRFLDAEGNVFTPSERHYITWESSDPSVATVDQKGHVRALKSGNTVISSTVDGKTATCDLRVQVLVHEVTLNENEIYMLREATETTTIPLVATIRPSDPDDPTITYTTNNDLVAKVDQDGLVTMTGGYGTAVITARAASGAEARFTVSVVVKLPELDPETGEITEPAVRAEDEAVPEP
ncbi:MAG: Ig-like domain-containing protein [Clostridia bacterium]|nr:Ig-like domain-containing protein [Clostridia bacterium]